LKKYIKTTPIKGVTSTTAVPKVWVAMGRKMGCAKVYQICQK